LGEEVPTKKIEMREKKKEKGGNAVEFAFLERKGDVRSSS